MVVKKVLLQTQDNNYDMEYKIQKKDINANRNLDKLEKHTNLHLVKSDLTKSISKMPKSDKTKLEVIFQLFTL